MSLPLGGEPYDEGTRAVFISVFCSVLLLTHTRGLVYFMEILDVG